MQPTLDYYQHLYPFMVNLFGVKIPDFANLKSGHCTGFCLSDNGR